MSKNALVSLLLGGVSSWAEVGWDCAALLADPTVGLSVSH